MLCDTRPPKAPLTLINSPRTADTSTTLPVVFFRHRCPLNTRDLPSSCGISPWSWWNSEPNPANASVGSWSNERHTSTNHMDHSTRHGVCNRSHRIVGINTTYNYLPCTLAMVLRSSCSKRSTTALTASGDPWVTSSVCTLPASSIFDLFPNSSGRFFSK